MELSSAVLISLDNHLIENVKKILKEEIPKLSKEKIIKNSLRRKGAIIKIKSLEESLKVINLIAPEHLHLVNQNPDDVLKFSPFAGMILVGEDTPNALSDYVLGPSHILPTGGTSKFSSPLSTDDFLIKSSLVALNKRTNPGKYQELILSPKNYFLVTIPPNIWNGFKNLDHEESIIANCLNIPHNEKEMVRENHDSKNFNFDWSK